MADSRNLVLQLLITARDEASSVLGRVRQSLSSVGDIAMTVAKTGLAALVAGIAAMGAAFAKGIADAADFETVMARIQASGVSSAAELKKVADAAKDMGVSTGAGAAQAAVGLEGLIKAGLSTTDAISTLPNILALASGQMLAMDDATSLVIKTVNQFGLSFADSKEVVDTLATGANVAATSVQELTQGLENSGLEARKAGLSLQETVAALNTLMQNGQDAAGAGEALQSMLLELSDVSGPAREALRSVGVATGDFQTILALLAKGGPEASAVMSAFGETALTAAGILGNALPFYQEQVKQINAVGVSAQDAADIMGKTFNEQVKVLNATWGEFWQTLAEPVLPALTESLKTLTAFITENRQALSDWVTLGFSPLTQTIDLVRYGIAQWNGDTEKAAQINQQLNERLAAVTRALSGTSAEYANAKTAAESHKIATEDAAQATERQTAALNALQDAIREHTLRANEAAAGSALQAFHTEQARLAQAQYDAELKKGLPTAQQHVTAQQAAAKSLDELHVAYQVAAAMVERLTEQNKKGLATDQQVTEAKLAKTRAEGEYTSAAKLGTEAAEKNLKLLQAEAPTIEAVSAAKLAQQQAILKLAQARGDEQTVAEAQLAITQLEVQQAADLALNKTRQAVESAKLLNAKKEEYALTIQSNAGQQQEIRLLEETVQQKIAEQAAAWASVEAREREIQQAEIMAGPIGRLTRLYAEQTQEHQRAAEASARYYSAQVQEAEGALKLAQIKGDAQEIDKAQVALDETKIQQAQAMANARATEAQDAANALSAKTLELAADGELSAADQQQIADLEAVVAAKRDAANAAQENADQMQAEAQAARDAAAAADEAAAAAQREKDAAESRASAEKAASTVMSDALSVLRATGGELDVLSARFYELQGAVTSHAAGWDGWAAGTARAAQEVKTAYETQKTAVDAMTAALQNYADTGEWSASVQQMMIRAGGDLTSQFDLMDQQSLDGLRSALDSANDKLREMADITQSARDKLASLNADLLEAQGQDQKAELLRQQLDYQQQLAEIERQRQEAENAGNTEALSVLNQQRDVLEEINRIKTADIQNTAQQTQQTRTATSSASSSAAAASSAPTARYEIKLTAGAKTLTASTNSNPQSFLDELENAQRLSA